MAGAVVRPDNLVPGTFVERAYRLPYARIPHYQRCTLPPLGAHEPASRIFRIRSLGTGSNFNRRNDRVVLMISNRSIVLVVSSGMASSFKYDQCAQRLRLAAARLEFAPYSVSIQVFDPTSLTATFEKKRCSGLPLCVPR